MIITNATIQKSVVKFGGFFEVRRSRSSVEAFVVEAAQNKCGNDP